MANSDRIDETDQKLLDALAVNSRLSLKELAQAAGMSSPSAAERLRRLEERGIIRAFTIDIDSALSCMSCTKERSILILSTGRRFR